MRMIRVMAAALILAMLAPMTAMADYDWFSREAQKQTREYIKAHSGTSKKDRDDGKYGVLVDTKKNRTYVYQRQNGEWVRVKTMKCCTGKASSPTPKGKSKIGKKTDSFTVDGKDYNYVTYFSDGCAFHSTPETGGKYSNRSLGKSESHGCVRLAPKDAKWIYQNVPSGTEVYVK